MTAGIVSSLQSQLLCLTFPNNRLSYSITLRSRAILLMNKTNTLPGADPIVLAIDDDRIVLRLIEAILTKHNYVVKTASSGEEALTILREITPAVLILDVMMPGISGYDLCWFLKQEDCLKDIPVIFLKSRAVPK